MWQKFLMWQLIKVLQIVILKLSMTKWYVAYKKNRINYGNEFVSTLIIGIVFMNGSSITNQIL